MEDVRKLLMTYVKEVDGMLGIVLCDRDGIPIVRCTVEDCPEPATRPDFLSTHASATEQAGKMGLGANQTIMAVYQNYQVIHIIYEGVVITVIATADAILNELRNAADALKPLVKDIAKEVLDPITV